MATKEIAQAARIQLRLNYAEIIAKRSNQKRHRVGAVIYLEENRPFASGWSHPSELNLTRYPLSIHAELHAVLRSPTRANLFGATIYIARIAVKSGNVGLAAPCLECKAMLFEAGIRNVYYTISSKDFGHILLTKS